MLRLPNTIAHAAYLAAFLAVTTAPALSQSNPPRTPVLVELFTSEGCSSCPPADALLARLLKDQPVPTAEILVLEEHVDYWDSLGWHDRFSSNLFTGRQSRYTQRLRADDNYTPQMIVDGTDQFVGNDSAHALRAITQAARAPKLTLSLSPLIFDGTQLSGEVSLKSSTKIAPGADLYAAVIESMASTHVQRGENGGRTLQHVSIVRTLQRIGSPSDVATKPLRFSVAVPKDATPANLRVVIFLQRPDQGAILGAVSSDRAPAPTAPTSLASAHSQLPH
jgi:hypothetical protein